jgi:hypothetical protein
MTIFDPTALARLDWPRDATGSTRIAPGRVRALSPGDFDFMAIRALAEAFCTRCPATRTMHGGSVANAYNYPAFTAGALAVAFPGPLLEPDFPDYPPDSAVCLARAHLFLTRRPANKVTLRGIASACLPAARPLWDRRYSGAAKRRALDELPALSIRDHWPVYATCWMRADLVEMARTGGPLLDYLTDAGLDLPPAPAVDLLTFLLHATTEPPQ